MCLDECTHDWLGNPVNEWVFVPWRDPQVSLTMPLAAERVERSGDTAKKFFGFMARFWASQSECARHACCETSLDRHVAFN